MPAFNKRLRETTYAGMKIKVLAGFSTFLVAALMSFTTIFNNSNYVLGGCLIFISIIALLYGIREVILDDDYRVRSIRSKASKDFKAKQDLL